MSQEINKQLHNQWLRDPNTHERLTFLRQQKEVILQTAMHRAASNQDLDLIKGELCRAFQIQETIRLIEMTDLSTVQIRIGDGSQ